MTCLMGYLHAAMKTKKTSVAIGIDLGDRKQAICVLDANGEVIKQESIRNACPSLTALNRRHPKALMVIEATPDPAERKPARPRWNRPPTPVRGLPSSRPPGERGESSCLSLNSNPLHDSC